MSLTKFVHLKTIAVGIIWICLNVGFLMPVLSFPLESSLVWPTDDDDSDEDHKKRGPQPSPFRIYAKLARSTKSITEKVKKVVRAYIKEHDLPAGPSAMAPSELFTKCRSKLVRWPGTAVKRQDHIITAMKILQSFVSITQLVQLLDFQLADGLRPGFVRKFRRVEFALRNFVEDDLRKAVYLMAGQDMKKHIPPYKIGVLSLHKEAIKIQKNKMKDIRFIIANYLSELWLCLNIFKENDIY